MAKQKNKQPKKQGASMFKKTKTFWIIFVVCLIIGVILFGSPIFNIASIILNFIGKIFGWLATALSWLGDFFDFFGLGGIF